MEFQHPLDEREVEVLKIRKFNRSRGIEEKQLTANATVDCIAGFHPDGKRGLFLCSLELAQGWHSGIVAVVDLDSGKATKQYGIHNTDYPSAAFSPCGQYICISSINNLLVFDLKTDQKINLIPGCADKFLTYSEDGKYLFTGGAVFSCIEISTGKTIWNTSFSEREGTTHGVRNIIHVPKTNKLICSTEFNDIFITNSLTGKVLKHFRDNQFNYAIDYSKEKNALIRGIEDDIIVFPDFL